MREHAVGFQTAEIEVETPSTSASSDFEAGASFAQPVSPP
jgi:hypothetical protein